MIMYSIKKKVLKLLAIVIKKTAISTVNSTCYTMLGQMEEPKTLSRYKKH